MKTALAMTHSQKATKNETLELFAKSDFSFTEINQLEKQNEMTNENNCSQYNHRSVHNNVDHCNNPTIVRDKLSNIVTTL